jgi:hypothetical protein
MSYKPSNYRAAGICYDLRHKMLHGDHSEVASENRKLVGGSASDCTNSAMTLPMTRKQIAERVATKVTMVLLEEGVESRDVRELHDRMLNAAKT